MEGQKKLKTVRDVLNALKEYTKAGYGDYSIKISHFNEKGILDYNNDLQNAAGVIIGARSILIIVGGAKKRNTEKFNLISHDVQIKSDGKITHIFIDGKEEKGITSFSLAQYPNSKCTLTLKTLCGEEYYSPISVGLHGGNK